VIDKLSAIIRVYVRVQMYRLMIILTAVSVAMTVGRLMRCHGYICGVKFIMEDCASCITTSYTDTGL